METIKDATHASACKRSSNSLNWSLVVCTVARSYSDLHAPREALLLAGSAGAFHFPRLALLVAFSAVIQGWQGSCWILDVSLIMEQSAHLKETETSKWDFPVDNSFANDWHRFVPGSNSTWAMEAIERRKKNIQNWSSVYFGKLCVSSHSSILTFQRPTVSLFYTCFNSVSIGNNCVVKLVLVLGPTSAALTRVPRPCFVFRGFLRVNYPKKRQNAVSRTFRFVSVNSQTCPAMNNS